MEQEAREFAVQRGTVMARDMNEGSESLIGSMYRQARRRAKPGNCSGLGALE